MSVLVIGLDGVPHWLLQSLADRGVMPNVAALLPQGTLRPLSAPVPDISSTSWSSFLTGTDPGDHGIYGFIDLEPGSYRTYFPNLHDLRSEPLWLAVERAGDASLVLNVPGTYPAPALDGALVAGFVAPNFARAVHPPELHDDLRAFQYELDVEVGDVAGDPVGFLDRLDAVLDARRRAFRWLLGSRPWRLAICVITETDRLHHFLWSQLMDPNAPLHPRILDFYGRVDATVGELLEAAPDATPVLVSDHGFGPAAIQFSVNSWLRQVGYLDAHAASLEEIDSRTTAFALDPARIYLNRGPRFPGPRRSLDGRGWEAVRAELTDRLLALRRRPDGTIAESGDGDPIVSEVLRGDELYVGPQSAGAPDLVAMPAHDVQLRGAWSSQGLTVDSPLTGTHTRHDALFWCRGDRGEGQVQMRDVAPSVLAEAGLSPLPGMRGVDVRATTSAAEADPLASAAGHL